MTVHGLHAEELDGHWTCRRTLNTAEEDRQFFGMTSMGSMGMGSVGMGCRMANL
jgi:hypothetical protein